MKLKKLLFATAAIMMVTGAYAQRANRSDICQSIPGLTIEQQQKIDKLSVTHQKTMDGLRAQFYSERDAVKASGFKTQMNTEMKNHYQNISGLLTPEQEVYFDQNCNVNRRSRNYYSVGYGGGQGFGRGQGYRRGQGYGRGQGFGRGQSFGRGQGRGYGRSVY
ncbi:MAG: hypothetical protein KAR19_07820 [Bacteroidales bacterium]|nr:hypothetical protein [Bacteroidales bacterium]